MTKSRDASRYRDDAARFRQRAAAAADDTELRDSYLGAAREFERLAHLLEQQPGPSSAPGAAARPRTGLRLSGRNLQPTHRGAAEPVNADRPAVAPMATILVIDADPAVRIAAKSVLDPAGLIVIATADAAAALTQLAVLKADLVICDIGVSAPDGRPAITAIAAIAPSAEIVTLVPKRPDTETMSPDIGNALEKPFTASELLRKVRQALIKPPPPTAEL